MLIIVFRALCIYRKFSQVTKNQYEKNVQLH